MPLKPLNGRHVEFKNLGGIYVPLQPWPQSFYVSRVLIDCAADAIELRSLTVTGLLKGVCKNFISMYFWRLCYLLRLTGFLATPEGERFSLKHWRWAFWRYKLIPNGR